MKKFYVEAELEVVDLLNADIITTSGGEGDNEGDTSDLWG